MTTSRGARSAPRRRQARQLILARNYPPAHAFGMNRNVGKCLAELPKNPELDEARKKIRQWLAEMDVAGDGNIHALVQYEAVEWIISQPRPLLERPRCFVRLISLEGVVHIKSTCEFCGWND